MKMTVSKNRKRGKNNEGVLARRLHAKRVGILQGEDIQHQIFSIEAKERKRLPVFLVKAYQQAKDNCPHGKIPLLILP